MPTDDSRTRPSFESIYRDHFDFVFRAVHRLCGLTVDPEDAVQEVFMVVSRRLDRYDANASSITTWMYGIAINVVRAMRRRRARELLLRADESEAEDVPVAASADPVEVANAWRIANQILDEMPAKKRDVFILAELEGLGCAEIGRIVGIPEATVWSRLHYARRLFSAKLAKRARKGSDPTS